MIRWQASVFRWHLEFLGAMPVVEQLSMGLQTVKSLGQGVAIYYFLSVVFLLTALTFVPIGQLCGRLMTRRPHLRAYGLNLGGSLVGVLAAFAGSALWTLPIAWFAVALLAVLLFSVRRASTLLVGVAGTLVIMATLAWPTNPPSHRVYSPYQMLEFGYGDGGLMNIRAAGHYDQRVHDFRGLQGPTTGGMPARARTTTSPIDCRANAPMSRSLAPAAAMRY